jgi:hypothetical protein
MDIPLAMKILSLVIENAGAVPEAVALFDEVKGDLQGHADNGTVPTQEYLDDLVKRAQTIAQTVGAQ